MAPKQPGHEIHLSIVAPARDEAENLPRFVEEVRNAMDQLETTWELIVVDDGSSDTTKRVLRELFAKTPRLRVIAFSESAGKSAAWQAGFRAARGAFIATIDADLQNDPRDIIAMLHALNCRQCDMINGMRSNRNDPWLRLISSRIANGVRNCLTGERITDSACGLKVFRWECVVDLRLFEGLHRFLPTLVKMQGFTVAEISISHRPRSAGSAKYGVQNRLFKGLKDALVVRWMKRNAPRYRAQEWERPDG
mgnify:FL=1